MEDKQRRVQHTVLEHFLALHISRAAEKVAREGEGSEECPSKAAAAAGQ